VSEEGWTAVPLAVTTDPVHGGRWTSLRSPGREWLWTNPDPGVAAARSVVAPGDAFVDAGGVEECLPTVRGLPDHGDAWSRAWDAVSGSVEVSGVGRLRREIDAAEGSVEISYELIGRPGTAFLHAVHALLAASESARLVVPEWDSATVLDPEPHPVEWPSGLDRLGPDDGTATCVLLTGCSAATILDGDDALDFTWTAPGADDLCSLLFWRNLGGWPDAAPYRSIGVEPTIGRAADLSSAADRDCVHLDHEGRHAWQLRVGARTRRMDVTGR